MMRDLTMFFTQKNIFFGKRGAYKSLVDRNGLLPEENFPSAVPFYNDRPLVVSTFPRPHW